MASPAKSNPSSGLQHNVPIRILIVDDDADICNYMSSLLAEQGFEVESINNPTQTLDSLKDSAFHIVVLDLIMPGLHGMELLDQIRRFDSDIAIIVVTGYPSVETAVQSLKHSVSDYIRKPFDVDAFIETIENILRKKGLLTNPEEELHATIGRNIRALRKESSLTLKQMSRRTGLSVSLLSQIERAESSASVSSLYKIALALDRRLTDFFGDF